MTIEIPIITTLKDKGLKDARKGLNSLSKAAKTLGVAYGAFEAIKFSKNAVKAFAEDQKAAGALSKTLENLGQSYAIISTAGFIQKLQNTTGILDDELRPAFVQLVNSTLDAKKAQDLLSVALDVSAGTTKDLQTVTVALSKAAIGEKGAIAKLGVGLNAAQLKTMSLADITDYLTKKFDGQASLAAESFAGKIAILQAHASDASETIGGSLLKALDDVFGDPEKVGSGIDSLASKISKLIDQTSRFVEIQKGLFRFQLKMDSPSVAQYKLNFDKPYDPMSANFPYEKLRAEEKKNQAASKKALAAQLAATKALTAEAKKQAALKKSQAILDLDQIQIFAALQNKVTENEKLRLSLQLAILQENSTEAQRLATQLALSQLKTTDLGLAISKLPPALYPFKGWSTEIDDLIKKILEMLGLLSKIQPIPLTTGTGAYGNYDAKGRYIGTPFGQAGSNVSTFIGSQGGYDMAANYVGTPFGQAQPSSTTNIYVNGATQQLLNELRNGLIDSSASGSFATINSAAG
jgi:hypothetical protein